MYFHYGDAEIEFLKMRDKKLDKAIDAIGHVNRRVDPDLFSALVRQIIGQQISTKAQASIWMRMRDTLGEVTPQRVNESDRDFLQEIGISYRKVDYIKDIAAQVSDGSFDLQELWDMPDDKVIRKLSSLRGVGVWTAQMILLFCMERPDVLSFDDLGIQRGLRLLYHHRTISRELFEKYRRRYSPCGSVASLYLWEVAGGALERVNG